MKTPLQPRPSALDGTETACRRVALVLAVLLLPRLGQAQDIEPRRWSHLPIGANFAGAAYAYSYGDISLDPVLKIQNGQFDLQTMAVKYIRSFDLLGKSARVDLTRPMNSATGPACSTACPPRCIVTDSRTPPCASR